MKKKKITKKSNWLLQNKFKIFLGILFVIAFSLRFYGLPYNLFFGPEQGIDLMKIKDIAINYNPVLVGAKTDVNGVFHGPIYYYLSVIPFLLSGGDPVFIIGFFIALNSLTVLLLYKLASELLNRRAGVISAILFTISFGAISYSRWLSSQPLTIPLSSIFFLGLVLFLKGKRKYLFLSAVSYGLIGQVEFLNYLFFGIMLLIIGIVYWKTFWAEKKTFLLANISVLLFFGFANYALFEVRNGFLMTKSVILLLTSPGYHFTILKSIQITISVFIESVGGLFLPSAIRLGVVTPIIGVVLLARSKKYIAKRLLIIWFLTPIVLLIFLRQDVLMQFFVYAVIPGILLNAYVWERIIQWKKSVGFFVFFLVIGFYISVWFRTVPSDSRMFYQSTQPDITISDENMVIDKIYKQMNGKNFSFQSYTIPYWTQDGWEYLFWQRGLKKYGYLPVTENGKTLFVIVQDDPSGQYYQDDWLKNTVPKWGTQVSRFRQGVFTVLVLKVK